MKKGMMKSKNKVMLITMGIIVLAIAVLAVIGNIKKGSKENIPIVDTVSVSKGNVVQKVEASGNVESEVKKTFFSPVNGTIQTMSVEMGDSVDADQQIIGFNLETLETENQKAELNVRSGELELQDAQQQMNDMAAKKAEANAKIPELEGQIADKQAQIDGIRQQIQDRKNSAEKEQLEQIEKAEQEYQNQKAEYETDLKTAEETRNQLQMEFNKAKEDYENQLISVEEYSKAEIAYQTAEEEYRELKDNPPVKEEISGDALADTSDLEMQLEAASSELAQLQSELASKQAAAEADTSGPTNAAQNKMRISNNLAELEAKNIQELLEEGRKGIHAEFKGVISDAKVTQGATVTQGMELFTLQSTDQVCVDANISKYDFDKVKEGETAEVTLGEKTYKGTVEKVSKIAVPNEKGTPLIGVTVHIDNPDDNIFIGVEAKVDIQAAEAKNVPVLPIEAVNVGKTGSFCYVIEDGVITKKDIETGVTSDSYVEIKSGLKEKDQVIKDIGNYEEGDKVRAKEDKTSK